MSDFFPYQSIGPCKVHFKGNDMGDSDGPVKFGEEIETATVLYAQTGKTPRKKIVGGRVVKCDLKFAELTAAMIAMLTPGVSRSRNHLVAGNAVGTDLSDYAGELELIRIVNGAPSTDPADIIRIFRAEPEVSMDLSFDVSTLHSVPVHFEGLPDTTSGNVGNLWESGNPA